MLCAAGLVAGGICLSARQLPSEPRRQFGAGITGAFEGWFESPDGSRSFLVGYLNRNTTQVLDVPIGPNNRIEPGGPDMGQPTHFLPGRRYGMFVVPVPGPLRSTPDVDDCRQPDTSIRSPASTAGQSFKEIAAGNTTRPAVCTERPGGRGHRRWLCATRMAVVGAALSAALGVGRRNIRAARIYRRGIPAARPLTW